MIAHQNMKLGVATGDCAASYLPGIGMALPNKHDPLRKHFQKTLKTLK